MNTLSRYILKEFFKPLIFILIVFVGLYIIAQLVDEMRSFVKHQPPFSLIILYYLYRVPYFAVQVLPLSVLLSSLFSLGLLARNHELIAMRSCGVSFLRITAPILIATLVLVGGVFVFNEIVIPFTTPRALQIKAVNIEKKADYIFRMRRDRVTRSASGNRILHIRHLDAVSGTMKDVILLELGPNRNLERRIDAPEAVWHDGHWVFYDGILRTFSPDIRIQEFSHFAELSLPFKESPQDFIREEKDADELLSMTLRELAYRIQLLRETGSDPRTEQVNYHLKVAFPFANVVLALLGVSLPFIFPTSGRALVWGAIGFVITILTGFFYIGMVAVGTSFGKNGALPPLVSVWLANILFTGLGVWLMRKAQS